MHTHFHGERRNTWERNDGGKDMRTTTAAEGKCQRLEAMERHGQRHMTILVRLRYTLFHSGHGWGVCICKKGYAHYTRTKQFTVLPSLKKELQLAFYFGENL